MGLGESVSGMHGDVRGSAPTCTFWLCAVICNGAATAAMGIVLLQWGLYWCRRALTWGLASPGMGKRG